MEVCVNFLSFQRAITCTDSIKVPLTGGMRVVDVFQYICAHYPQLALDENELFVTVNNDISAQERELQSNDALSFIPHIGGG